MSYLLGHRQRLRDRFNGSGLGAFEDHEVLELLLTYAVPRKDVKPIARGLLGRFGSLSNVLDAPTAELTKVDGVGYTGALQKVCQGLKAAIWEVFRDAAELQ